jgi:hypothetical protein
MGMGGGVKIWRAGLISSTVLDTPGIQYYMSIVHTNALTKKPPT